jgi:hypothetical protein
MLNRFARWFSSAAGVWQTVLFCTTWVTFERVFRQSDPNGFVLLYVMTVYSAVTQPVLAYTNRLDTEKGSLTLQELRSVLDRISAMEEAILEDTEDLQHSREKD